MRRQIAWAVAVISIVGGTTAVFAPAAGATSKELDRYTGTVSDLKRRCNTEGGTYIGSTSGRHGVCVWPDGRVTSCSKGKGQNCRVFGRVLSEDDSFLGLVEVALASPSVVTVVEPDDAGSSGNRQPGRKLIRGLLAKEDFKMSLGDLETKCSSVLGADLMKRNDGSLAACLGDTSTIFCDAQQEGKNCAIEAPKGSLRKALQLIRIALVDPASVTIIVGGDKETSPPPTASPSTSTTTTLPPTTTSSTTTTTTTPEPAFL